MYLYMYIYTYLYIFIHIHIYIDTWVNPELRVYPYANLGFSRRCSFCVSGCRGSERQSVSHPASGCLRGKDQTQEGEGSTRDRPTQRAPTQRAPAT